MSSQYQAQVLASVPDQLLIGGDWRPASDASQFAVLDPATGEVIKHVADGTPADGVAALSAAADSATSWAATAPRERSAILQRAFDLLLDRAEEFAVLITLEMGKPLTEARGEVTYGAEFLRWFSEEAPRVQGRYGTSSVGNGRVVVTQHPVGPCLLITPWNFPLAMATRKIAPALAAGCTVIVKPADLTPLTTLLLATVLQEAGVPAGVINVCTTSSAGALTEPLLRDRRLRKLSFTGSTAIGVHLLQSAAQGVLRTSMELGGNAPFLVFEDADVDLAVEGALKAKFRNMGQACTAANRVLVQRSVAAEFTRRIVAVTANLQVGRGTDDGVSIGPLINEGAVVKTKQLIDDAVARGATIELGGHPLDRPGTFFAPTVLTNVDETSELLREEIFGPVLTIIPFEDENEAVRIANDTDYGLVSYVFTKDLARGQRLIERLETGMTGLNVGVVSNAAAPFGGWKHSGLGHEGGPEGIQEYLQTKYTLTADPFA